MELYKEYWSKCLHTGSRVICNPPVTNTDDDYVLLCSFENYKRLRGALFRDVYEPGGSGQDLAGNQGGKFESFKRGDINLIITYDEDFFEKFRLSTILARDLNLLRKEDRITLFRAMREEEFSLGDDLVEYGHG